MTERIDSTQRKEGNSKPKTKGHQPLNNKATTIFCGSVGKQRTKPIIH
jgi:hypothetical protein